MENGNRLDLTLSLPCGGPSSGAKGKNEASSEARVEEADRGSKLIDDFKNFLDGANHKEEPVAGPQRSNQSKPEENLFYDLSKGTANAESSKRKNMFEEINDQKRHERDVYLTGLHVKARTPHVSITTDEGSTAENEDVADSEAEGSTSKLDASKRSDSNKDVSGVDLKSQSQRRFTISSEKDFKVGNGSHGVPFSGQSANILNMPYSLSVKESNSIPVNQSQAFPVMGSASNDRPGNQQPVIPANLPLMFGYSPAQLPTVEAGKSEGPVSHSLQYQPSYFGRGPPNQNQQNDGLKINQAATPINAPKPFERANGDGIYAKEEGSSMHTEGDVKGSNGNGIDTPRTDGVPPEYPAIRPGIAAELKFGGSGSSPNLPWVSTTGPGPNGKTISGVTYRYSGTQIRIVCACHGSHLSPEEFVQHASEEQPTLNGGSSGLPSFPNSNPAASAQN
ncbi:ninja-family protein mc410 [Tanacetum coccineum]